MIRPSRLVLLSLALILAGCEKPKPPRSAALPDNVNKDVPIILKEGQGVILVPENNPSLKIAASVVGGKLTVLEMDPKGKSFSVTWNDDESWSTSVTETTVAGETKAVLDKDGDGVPDIRMERADGSAKRFKLEDPKWTEVKGKE